MGKWKSLAEQMCWKNHDPSLIKFAEECMDAAESSTIAPFRDFVEYTNKALGLQQSGSVYDQCVAIHVGCLQALRETKEELEKLKGQ